MKSRIAMHVGAAALVVGLAVTSALAIENSAARLNVTLARAFKFDVSLKQKGGGGGKVRCEFDGQSGYFGEGTNLEGVIYVPTDFGMASTDMFLFIPGGKGSKITNTVAKTRFNSKKDDEGDAAFVAGQYGEFFTWFNGALRDGPMPGPMKKKSKAYVPLEDGFFFTSSKLASQAKVYSGFSKYNGSFKATLKGQAATGEKITGKIKVVYKAAERAF